MSIIDQLKQIEKDYVESTPFYGGRTFFMKDTTIVTVHYPATEVWSSVIDYIMNNTNHQVSIVITN